MTGAGVNFAETGIMTAGAGTGTTTDGVRIGGATMMAGTGVKDTATASGTVIANSMAIMDTETDLGSNSKLEHGWRAKLPAVFLCSRAAFEGVQPA